MSLQDKLNNGWKVVESRCAKCSSPQIESPLEEIECVVCKFLVTVKKKSSSTELYTNNKKRVITNSKSGFGYQQKQGEAVEHNSTTCKIEEGSKQESSESIYTRTSKIAVPEIHSILENRALNRNIDAKRHIDAPIGMYHLPIYERRDHLKSDFVSNRRTEEKVLSTFLKDPKDSMIDSSYTQNIGRNFPCDKLLFQQNINESNVLSDDISSLGSACFRGNKYCSPDHETLLSKNNEIILSNIADSQRTEEKIFDTLSKDQQISIGDNYVPIGRNFLYDTYETPNDRFLQQSESKYSILNDTISSLGTDDHQDIEEQCDQRIILDTKNILEQKIRNLTEELEKESNRNGLLSSEKLMKKIEMECLLEKLVHTAKSLNKLA